MQEYVGVRLSPSGKIENYRSGGLALAPREVVVVETMAGPMIGWVANTAGTAPEASGRPDSGAILRRASEADIEKTRANIPREREALRVCRDRVEFRRLPMKLIDARFSLDASSVYINFASDTRVDFRELVRDVASAIRARVVFHQVGVRDHARAIDGLGRCGERLCCARFLACLEPVSMKMAKDQSLSITPEKFSGICGKLMCCLRFELDSYVDGADNELNGHGRCCGNQSCPVWSEHGDEE